MLAAVILTLNEAHHIVDCIDSLKWTDVTVVLDSFSTDATTELAQENGALVIQHPFTNYSQQRNVALDTLKVDWVLFVDADERVTPALAGEIRQVITNKEKAGWWIPRHNYILGHRMRGAGWWPDHQLRLLRRDRAYYDAKRAVHELAILDGPEGYLLEPLIHYNYETLHQFIDKQRRYTHYDVGILEQQGIKPHIYTPCLQALRHFWWRFITLKGWQDGVYGILLSGMMAYYELLKYRELRTRLRYAHS